MNKTLLLIIIDFLFLNLIALTHWENADQVRPQRPPVPTVEANAPVSTDADLVETMRQALADERSARDQLAGRLSSADTNLVAREQSISELQAERTQLGSELTESKTQADQLGKQAASAREIADLTKDQLAQLQRQLDERTAEADRQKRQLELLERDKAQAQKEIDGLNTKVAVDETEKKQLQDQTSALQTQVAREHDERVSAQAATSQLASGVDLLAENTGDLRKEIKENTPISANVLYDDFLKNRAQATFSATRPGLFGQPVHKTKESSTVFTTDGRQVYALLHVEDTVFSLRDDEYDWGKVGVAFDRPPAYHTSGDRIEFLQADPRVVVVPVDASQVTALAAKVYPLATDPFKFPDAVLVSATGKGYGAVAFKLDPAQPGYVKVDNRLFKRLFGDFAPSRGDLVFSHTGELLGVMVNSDYCALLKDFTPAAVLRTGEGGSQKPATILEGLGAQVAAMPEKLQ